MTKNQKRKYFALAVFLLGIAALAALILCRVLYGITFGVVQYIALPVIILIFAAAYRNFSHAVKEEEKYGPIEQGIIAQANNLI